VEEARKLFPVSVIGVSKERERGELCARVEYMKNKNEAISGQSDCGTIPSRSPSRCRGSKG
jgi:hypothetical protein